MRTLNPVLQNALDENAGDAVIKVFVSVNGSSWTEFECIKYKIDNLRAEVVIPGENLSITYNYFYISRGMKVAGTDYLVNTSTFYAYDRRNTVNQLTLKGHLFVNKKLSTSGYDTVENVLTALIAQTDDGGFINTFSAPTGRWFTGIKFFPTGRSVTVNSQRLEALIRQKYMAQIVDRDSNTFSLVESNEFEDPSDIVIDENEALIFSQYAKNIPNNFIFISRDETGSTNTLGTEGKVHNFGYIESTVSITVNPIEPDAYYLKIAPPKLELQYGDRVENSLGHINTMAIVEYFDISKTPAWWMEISAMEWTGNTEGGSIPSTLEAAAPYTPLVSSGFNGNLDSSVNNLQALAEAVDNLTLGGTYDLAADIHAATSKTTPVDADELGIWDSVASALKKLTWANLKATLKTYFDTLYSLAGHSHSAPDASVVTYTPADSTDWNSSSDPGDVDNALDQLADRTKTLEGSSGGREVLTTDRTYYVRTDGSNSNTGLANTSGGAFLTVQKAIDVVYSLDLSIYNVTIQIADGTYTTPIVLSKPFVGKGSVSIQGNSTTPANVIISTTSANAFDVSNGAVVNIKDLKIQTTTSGNGIYVEAAIVNFYNLNFGACANNHMLSTGSALIYGRSNYAISGGALRHWFVTGVATIIVTGVTVTITGTPNFSFAFGVSGLAACLSVYSNTYSGSATGKRYDANMNGIIYTAGATLPGNSAGSTATGGQYA